MPLSDQFHSPIRIQLGLTVHPLEHQVQDQGLVLSDPELWEDRHRAWNLLRIGGFLTAAEEARIADRLLKGICRAVGYQDALRDLAQQVLSEVQPEEGTPPQEESAPLNDRSEAAPPEGDGALDIYLTNQVAGTRCA